MNGLDGDTLFAAILERFDLSFRTHGVWNSVGESSRVQGWKVHISSIPVEAVALLECVVPLLASANAVFKFARTPSLLAALNEGALGDFQVGKFMTIYPDNDAAAIRVAERLTCETSHFHGPVIATDVRLGAVVYARYGGFNPVVQRDRLGQRYLAIYDIEGALKRDRYSVPFVLPDGVSNPFESLLPKPARRDITLPSGSGPRLNHLFGPGYLLFKAVRTHPKGGVFLAADLRDQRSVGLRALKQGRQFCLSDTLGRDIRDRLKHQARLSRLLSPSVCTPAAHEYFEVNGHGYLPLDWIEGVSLLDAATTVSSNRTWSGIDIVHRAALLRSLRSLAENLNTMHAAGFVHRDLSPTNVVIRPDDSACLIDLELAYALGDSEPPYGKGTPGYMSPEQELGRDPDPSQDVFSFGCLLVLLLVGCDPQRVLWVGERGLAGRLRALAGGADRVLTDLAAQCVTRSPRSRPSMNELRARLNVADTSIVVRSTARGTPGIARLDQVIAQGCRGILADCPVDERTGLWLSLSDDVDPASGASRSLELRRDAHHGVAGVLFTLARLAGLKYIDAGAIRGQMAAGAEWLLSEPPAGHAHLPGLYFGDGGVAAALFEARKNGFDVAEASIRSLIARSAEAPLDWLDLTHGAAGQGIAAILCEPLIAQPRDVASRFVRVLAQAQQADGSWRVPPGVEGLSGQTLSGLGHGCAGIVYYLSACHTRFGFSAAEESCERGVAWLATTARKAGDECLEWDYSDSLSQPWKWWCHGSPGIALAFLELFRRTGKGSYAKLAEQALNIHVEDARASNLSTCHGLAGLGEIYLEAGFVLNDNKWFRRAEWVARTLMLTARRNVTGTLSWLVEDPYRSTADLMVGSAGVLHFLARFATRNPRLSFPLLLPVAAS